MTNLSEVNNNTEFDKPPEYNELDKSNSSQQPPAYPGVATAE